MLSNGWLDTRVNVKGLENSIKTSTPDVDWVLEGAGQHGMVMAILQS